MNKRDLKDLFEQYYKQSLNSFEGNSSSITVIESVKSIVGINLNKDSANLMLWLDDYMQDYKVEKFHFNDNLESPPEVISYKNLESSIVDKDVEKSFKNISYLSTVSDGTQIMEFLLELSLRYSFETFQLIWSIYRMEMFLSRKFLSSSLQVCVKSLIDGITRHVVLDDSHVEWIDLLKSHQRIVPLYYNVYNTDLIRSEKINELIFSNLNKGEYVIDRDYDYKVLKEQKTMGREWILNYFNNMNIENISPQLIIDANNIRSCLKSATEDNEKITLWGELNRYIDATC